VSLNQWIAAAVAENVGGLETEFLKKRARKATGEGLMKFLRTAPKVAPEPQICSARRHAPTKIRSDNRLPQASFFGGWDSTVVSRMGFLADS